MHRDNVTVLYIFQLCTRWPVTTVFSKWSVFSYYSFSCKPFVRRISVSTFTVFSLVVSVSYTSFITSLVHVTWTACFRVRSIGPQGRRWSVREQIALTDDHLWCSISVEGASKINFHVTLANSQSLFEWIHKFKCDLILSIIRIPDNACT